jgi:hypothetical protein
MIVATVLYLRIFLLPFAVLAAVATANAQSAGGSQAAPQSLYFLSAAEATAARTAAQSDARLISIVGAGPTLVQTSGVYLLKPDVKRSVSGQQGPLPRRYISVLIFNQGTSRAARARVELQTNRIVNVERVPLDELPIFREEAEQAVALARTDAKVRTAVGATIDNYRLRMPGMDDRMPFAAEIMPLLTSSVRDLCYIGRCVEVHYRNATGYLPLRVQVNLAARSVTILRRGPRSHGGHR